MAKRDEQQQRKVELLEQLTRQRSKIRSQRSRLITQIEEKKEEIKDKINVPKRIKNNIRSSFSSSPTKWFLGSAVGGLIISKVLFGKRKRAREQRKQASSSVSRSLLTSALFFFGKPLLKRAVMNKAKGYIANRFFKRQQQIPADEYRRY